MQLHERDEKLSALLAGKAALDEELKQLREEFAAVRKVNSAQPDTHDYTETETRDYFIDLLLKEAGWELDGKNFEIEVSGMLASTPLSQRDFETGRQSEADRSSLEVSTWCFSRSSARKQSSGRCWDAELACA